MGRLGVGSYQRCSSRVSVSRRLETQISKSRPETLSLSLSLEQSSLDYISGSYRGQVRLTWTAVGTLQLYRLETGNYDQQFASISSFQCICVYRKNRYLNWKTTITKSAKFANVIGLYMLHITYNLTRYITLFLNKLES